MKLCRNLFVAAFFLAYPAHAFAQTELPRVSPACVAQTAHCIEYDVYEVYAARPTPGNQEALSDGRITIYEDTMVSWLGSWASDFFVELNGLDREQVSDQDYFPSGLVTVAVADLNSSEVPFTVPVCEGDWREKGCLSFLVPRDTSMSRIIGNGNLESWLVSNGLSQSGITRTSLVREGRYFTKLP